MRKLRDVVERAETTDDGQVIVDPHRDSLAWKAFVHLVANGHEDRLLFDRLSDTRHVLQYKMFSQSSAERELDRRAENDEIVHTITDLLCRRRGTRGLDDKPVTEDGVRSGLKVFVEQEKERPPSDFPHLYYPKSKKRNEILETCTNQEAVEQFSSIPPGHLVPARRLVSATFESPHLQARCSSADPNWELGSFLENGGILLVEGGGFGNVSMDAVRIILGSIIHMTDRYARSRKKPFPRVRLVIDEATNADLIGIRECRMLCETQKFGLDVDILVQNPNYPTANIRDTVLQNCDRQRWFYCGDASVARIGANALGDSSLAERLMMLGPGEHYVKDHNKVYREYLPLLEDPWHFPGLSEKKAELALERMHERPEYHSGNSVEEESSEESRPIPAPSRISKTSSPADRLRAATSSE